MFSQTWPIRVDKMVGTFNPKYTYTKRGIYYFCKDVPADLRHHYTKLRIVQSLRTKSSTRAKHAAQSLVTRLEDYWFNLLPLPEDTETNNRPKPEDLFAHQSQLPIISGATLHQSRNIRVLL